MRHPGKVWLNNVQWTLAPSCASTQNNKNSKTPRKYWVRLVEDAVESCQIKKKSSQIDQYQFQFTSVNKI